ncbi:MAG: hypothetical protein KTR27_05570, partial [Leptolyngbyaceae cyanobacterium MAG.088]|nr:hypothetical protein [Leptolyngbyaceae cyanobacterium MAG.088]
NSLVVNGIPGIGTQSFIVENFVDVIGTTQSDNISGNSDDNFIDGNDGDDFIFGDDGDDFILGFNGNDTLDGWNGNDFIAGEAGDDLLLGYFGDDILDGGSGTDSLLGEDGNDALFGYGFTTEEYDVLTGGTGADAFYLGDSFGAYYLDLGYATITDFSSVEGDLIVLADTASAYSLGTQDISGTSSLDTLVYYNNDLIGVLEDTTSVNTSTDFVYV